MTPRPPRSPLFPYTTLFRSPDTPGAKSARLLFQVKGRHAGLTWLELRPHTGRKHQLRVQLASRSEEHTSELQSHVNLVCRLLLEKKKSAATAPVREYNRAQS